MQDRTFKQNMPPEEEPPWLQEVMRQVGGTGWERQGMDVVVTGGPRNVLLRQDLHARLAWEQGNPEAIAEIIEQSKEDRPTPKKRPFKRMGGKRR